MLKILNKISCKLVILLFSTTILCIHDKNKFAVSIYHDNTSNTKIYYYDDHTMQISNQQQELSDGPNNCITETTFNYLLQINQLGEIKDCSKKIIRLRSKDMQLGKHVYHLHSYTDTTMPTAIKCEFLHLFFIINKIKQEAQ